MALASWLSKGLGISTGKIARLLAELGVGVTAGGVGQADASPRSLSESAPAPYQQRGEIYRAKGDTQKAIEQFNRVLLQFLGSELTLG